MSEETVVLEQETRRLFDLLDVLDMDALGALVTDDVQGVDELTRSWMRGRAALEEHFARLPGMVADVHSRLNDLSALAWGDVGLVTLLLDQTYTADGVEQRISAPTSLIFRRLGDGWRLALVHSVPIADA